MTNFASWLQRELDRQGLKAADLARGTELHPSTISRLLKGEISEPSNEVYSRIAEALGEPIEKVLRAAGQLPPLSANEDPTIRGLVELVSLLPDEERQEVLGYADYRYRRYKERQNGHK